VDARTATLVWVDILGRRILRRALVGGTTGTPVAADVGCVALTESLGRVVAALRTGWHWCDLNTGDTQLIAAPERQHPDRRFNDGAVDAGPHTARPPSPRRCNAVNGLSPTKASRSTSTGFSSTANIASPRSWKPTSQWT
jgi:hypothetical protein